MKKINILIAMCCGFVSSCSSGNNTTSSNPPQFTINNVTMGAMDGDTTAAEFSTIINFTYQGANISNWQFGFYMARTFATLVSGSDSNNPNLVMQICSASNESNCVNLSYLKNPVTESDLSAGTTTMLAPSSSFTLIQGQQYTIKLLHNNQWGPGNYSAVPQNFFIKSGSNIANVTPESSVFNITSYNANNVSDSISQHISTVWASSNNVASNSNLIPSPVSYVSGTGTFTFSSLVIHNTMTSASHVATFLQQDLAQDLNLNTSIDNVASNSGIIIEQLANPNEINNNPEGYKIIIGANSIRIQASNATGVFYALQTLRQLWNQSPTINSATIIDYPRFKYRGVLLDSSRHFFKVNEVESLIDLAAAHKLNTLHWHLSDDEGMRVGLTGYSSIPTMANTRGLGNPMTGMYNIQSNLDRTYTGVGNYPYITTAYSGTYSEAELAAIIVYANARSITVIPEIDMPGHARALVKAFPSEMVDPNDLSLYMTPQGYTDDVLPICTYNTNISVGAKFTPLVNNIVTKIAAIFNNQTTVNAVANEMSVGGDEVNGEAWTNDSSCTGVWSPLNALEKSHKFFRMLSDQNSNLKLSGWQQYVQGNESDLGVDRVSSANAGHVWVWNNSQSGASGGQVQAVKLAQNNYQVVLDYSDQNYFDMTYTPAITEPGFYWATNWSDTYASLNSAVSASQTQAQLATDKTANIVGMEGTLWSENLPTYNHLTYMALPKMAGLAEASWSPVVTTNINNQPNWQDLARRLGCGQSGFLWYLNKISGATYRGYPNGINQEVPNTTICN